MATNTRSGRAGRWSWRFSSPGCHAREGGHPVNTVAADGHDRKTEKTGSPPPDRPPGPATQKPRWPVRGLIENRKFGVRPREPVTGPAKGRTRWRAMTAEFA